MADINDENIYLVIDALRHAFSCYAFNGLHQLYTRQENEGWFPKVVLTEVLEPNDIYKLDDEIILYRGCDIGEYNSGNYGQAWTTSLSVAKDFAYVHYQSQGWFEDCKRIVLTAKYSKQDVLFSHQAVEYEVVVESNKLSNVKQYT